MSIEQNQIFLATLIGLKDNIVSILMEASTGFDAFGEPSQKYISNCNLNIMWNKVIHDITSPINGIIELKQTMDKEDMENEVPVRRRLP